MINETRIDLKNKDEIAVKQMIGPALIPNDMPWDYKRKKDCVCICGTAPTLANTPWEDKDFEFWACSPAITYPEAEKHNFDLLFELHDADYYLTIKDRLNTYGKPVYMLEKTDIIPTSMTFPIKRIQSMVNNGYLNKYFTSTIAYMIALAICMGYKRIELWGIHMAADEEYGRQRQACEAWMGYAAGLGIDMYIPGQSELFRCPHMYGYQNKDSIEIQARLRKEGLKLGIAQLREEKKKVKHQLKLLEIDINKNEGAMIDSEYFEKRYS